MSGVEIAEWIGGVLVILGGIFMVIGSVGLVRMPDVFTRMHAASVADTLGVSLVLFGLVLFAGFSLVSVKLILLILFIALTSPTAAHAVARAALHAGVRPVNHEGQEIESPDTTAEEGTSSKP